jgi:nucleotide-binding universal stress UspA family protein
MIVVIAAAALLSAVVAALVLLRRRPALAAGPRRILFPFTGHALSQRALDAALRLARAEGATLVPVFLARVPMQLPLDSPLPRQCTAGLPLLETIEQRAAAAGVPVDARIDRGRTLRHAMREAISHERFDRLVVAAGDGFDSGDIAWLLDHAPGEVVIIRPAGETRDDRRAHRPQPLAV